jgi:hypothetical protein
LTVYRCHAKVVVHPSCINGRGAHRASQYTSRQCSVHINERVCASEHVRHMIPHACRYLDRSDNKIISLSCGCIANLNRIFTRALSLYVDSRFITTITKVNYDIW